MRGLLLSSVLMVSWSLAEAQGVPVVDTGMLTQEMAVTAHREADATVQKARSARQNAVLELDRQLIGELDRLIAAASVPPVATEAMIDTLEAGSGDSRAAARNLYDPTDSNPAASQAFGDAAVTVEEVIIAGSKATYAHPGVAKAGLSQAQWRALLQALIWQESRFNPYAQSPAGAFGLTQLMRPTAIEVGVGGDYRTNPYSQVVGGGTYLARMLDIQNGNIVVALAAYNAGPGNVQRYGGVPPFKETQNYVHVVPLKYNEYLAKIGGVDALGTIEPVLASGANFAVAADGLASYAAHAAEISLIAQRLKDVILAMQANENPSQAWVLNGYARAEMARIMALQTRLLAVRSRMVSADAMQAAAAAATERRYMQFSNE
jgi:hypothetical protein